MNKRAFLNALRAVPAERAEADTHAIRYKSSTGLSHCPLTVVVERMYSSVRNLSGWSMAGNLLGFSINERVAIVGAADSPPQWYHLPWGFKRRMWRIYRNQQRKAGVE
jgi:hypothetical protein